MAFDRSWMSSEEALEVADEIEKVGGVYRLVAAAIRYQNKENHNVRKPKRIRHTTSTNGSN
jgi:hypothetical protein